VRFRGNGNADGQVADPVPVDVPRGGEMEPAGAAGDRHARGPAGGEFRGDVEGRRELAAPEQDHSQRAGGAEPQVTEAIAIDVPDDPDLPAVPGSRQVDE